MLGGSRQNCIKLSDSVQCVSLLWGVKCMQRALGHNIQGIRGWGQCAAQQTACWRNWEACMGQ
jgi:hypothetical protein